MDYSRNATYFTELPLPKGGCSGCLGILLGLLGILWVFNGEIEMKYGIALIVVAGILTVLSSSLQKQNDDTSSKDTRISGSEYDAAIAKYVDGLSRTRALNKLGVDAIEVREIAPIILGGYEFGGAAELKRGEDKIWRSNIYKAAMLYFSRYALHCYTLSFKTTEDRILNEATDVYFYQDIVSASTESVNETVEAGADEIAINSVGLVLKMKDGASITINLPNSRHTQESVNAMLALLREKKQA